MPESSSQRDAKDDRSKSAQARPNVSVQGEDSTTSSSAETSEHTPAVGGHAARTTRTTNLSAQTTSASKDSRDAQQAAAKPNLAKSDQSAAARALQIQGSPAPTRGVEAPIWDWEPLPDDTTNTNRVETPDYFYEPQGELLQQRADDDSARTEFNIPQPVGTSPGSSAFAVPKRPATTLAGVKRKSTSDRDNLALSRAADQKRQNFKMSEASSEASSPPELTARPSASGTRTPVMATGFSRPRSGSDTVTGVSATSGASAARASVPQRQSISEPTTTTSTLPARKVFPIQIGDKLFRLSGASISSDSPSYFSQFFEEQLRQSEGAAKVRTLYIDRDPATFEDIALHLQGYHVEPRDGPHFVKLFADAQFFSLPRLTAQLFSSTIYIRIGDEEFQIPRDLFNQPGDSPNFFSLGFSIFFGSPTEAFPGLAQRTLLRPPSILPPSVPNRSAKTFADILHFLKGYPVEIRNEEHRQELLRDVRYFHLKGLEQRVIPHSISYNLVRQQSEIVIRLEDIRQSGVSFVADSARPVAQSQQAGSSTSSQPQTTPGWVFYQRPYADSEAHSLIVEINGNENTFLSIDPLRPNTIARLGRASFRRTALSRFTSLLTVIANKMALPITQPLGLMMAERGAGISGLPVSPSTTGLSEERVKMRISADADVFVDGKRWLPGGNDDDDDSDDTSMDVDPSSSSVSGAGAGGGGGKAPARSKQQDDDEGEEWVVKKAQWRLRIQPVVAGSGSAAGAAKNQMEVILGAVKIEAYSNERGRNMARAFLT